MFWQRGTSRNYSPGNTGGGGSDKPPGEFHVKHYEDANQAKAKIDDLVAGNKKFVVIITEYKDTD